MESFYTYCALIGGILFLGQLLMTFTGMEGGESDLDIDTDGGFESGGQHDSLFVGILSVRSVVAAITVFGIAGRGVINSFSPMQTSLIAFAAGAAVLFIVGWTFKQLYKIRADGTVHIQHAIDCNGKIYLKVPANKTGAGKVTVRVQNRTMEYQAMTEGEELPTGTPVRIISVISSDIVEVIPVTES